MTVHTQTYTFKKEDKQKTFKDNESYWDFHKKSLLGSIMILEDNDKEFQVIIKQINES